MAVSAWNEYAYFKQDVDSALAVAKDNAQVTYIVLETFWRLASRSGKPSWFSTKPHSRILAMLRYIADVVVVRSMSREDVASARKRYDEIKDETAGAKKHLSCFVCGDWATARHHIIQLQNGGEANRRNVVNLCHDCHRRIHPWMAATST